MVNSFHWCSRCRFPGRQEFLLGTVEAGSDLDAERKLRDLAAQLLPSTDFEYIYPIRGMLVFKPE